MPLLDHFPHEKSVIASVAHCFLGSLHTFGLFLSFLYPTSCFILLLIWKWPRLKPWLISPFSSHYLFLSFLSLVLRLSHFPIYSASSCFFPATHKFIHSHALNTIHTIFHKCSVLWMPDAISGCLLNIPIQMSHRHLELIMSKTECWFYFLLRFCFS